MKTTIYNVIWTSYTESDNFLYNDTKTFTSETEAHKEFDRQCQQAYDECEWGSQWDEPEDERDTACNYDVDETRDHDCYTVSSNAYDGYRVEVKLQRVEVGVPLPCGLPEPKSMIGDELTFYPDGDTLPLTAEVEGVELRVERDYDGSLITNTAYLVRDTRRTEWQNVWVYESEIIK